MATLARNPDDEEQQPQLAGVGASPMTQGAQSAPRTGSSSAMQPQQSAMQGSGSGFVNLQSFLSPEVAKQNQEKVQTLGTKLQGEEKTSFDKAADPLRSATFTPIQGSARQLVDKLVPSTPTQQQANPAAHIPGSKVENGRTWVPMPGFPGSFREYDPKNDGKTGGGSMPQPGEQTTAPQPKPDETALSSLKAMLEQDYTGPMSVDFTAGKSDAGKRLGLLGSGNTAVEAMNPGAFSEGIPAAGYGQGNSWLDNALVQGDVGTMGAIGNVKSGNEAFAKSVGEEKTQLGDKAKGLKQAAADARGKVRGDLEGYGNEILGGIDTRVGAANEQEAGDFGGKVLRDPTTGMVTTPGANQEMEGWEAGTGATRGNIATATEAGRLGKLASLLGMDEYNVGPGGGYVSGRHTTKTTPGAMTPKEVHEVPTWKLEQEAAMNPAQKSKYDEMVAKGYPPNEAIKLAKADNKLTVRSVKG